MMDITDRIDADEAARSLDLVSAIVILVILIIA